uniref:Tetratricopeptide repeat protein n=1 Tax=candidate division WOR-3 bacterium TaxID=2052148 RepID=A0A7V0Z7C0_UNCW3
MIKKFLFIILLLLLVANLSYRIDLKKTLHELIGELMYFPSGFAVRALSLGFYVPLADMVWLRFIQYYGEHRMTDARFDLMYHILDILTTLDPYFVHAYTLGALMLTHDANRPDQAMKLLKKGMRADYNEWRTPFIYGFINYVFLRDYKTALAYLRISSQKPNATDMPKRWAGYIALKRIGDLKVALALWLDLYKHAKNPEEKKIAEIYINETKMEMDIEFLNKKIDEFTHKMGRQPINLNELVVYKFIDSIPSEPHGEKYYLKGNKASSTWKKKK